MSETNISSRGITRRGFLKATGAAAGTLGLAGAMTATSEWLAPAKAVAEPEEHVSYLYHKDHCGCHCSLKCTVRDGRVCLIEPNDSYQDVGYRKICAKSISEIQHIYGDERIQTPMKRVGERGKAEFVSISWDEAYQILKENLEDAWDKYGHDSVLVKCASEPRPLYPFIAPILGATTQGAVGIDMGIGNGGDLAYGPGKGTTDVPSENSLVGLGYNRPTSEPRDLVNSKYILLVGNNVFTSVLTHGYILFDAQEAGAKTVAIDPHYSMVASKCDEWLSIQPGTDAALYLGLAKFIVDNDLYDEEFMKARTSFPFLVSVEDGSLLRVGEEFGVDDKGKPVDPGDFMVWDVSSGTALRHSDSSNPALSGEHIIDGVKYHTVFDAYKDKTKDYTLDWCEAVTDIPADKLKEIATDYATSGASAIVTGYGGNDKMTNADIVGHALVTLVSLTGNIAKPGALAGSFADGFHGYDANLASWKFPEGVSAASTKVKFFNMPKQESNIHSAIIIGDAPMCRTANYSLTEKWMSELDFLCAIDMYFTSYTDWADLILPASTPFENEDEISGLEAYGGYVLLRQKAIDPLFDSKSDYQIQVDIADLFGKRDLLPATQEEYYRYRLDKSDDPTITGITLDTLIENQGVQAQSCQSQIRRTYTNKFGTPSGKMEIYYDCMRDYGQELAAWEPAQEIGGQNELIDKYPLVCSFIKSKLRIHNQLWDALWLNQFEEPHIEMNPVDIDSRGLTSGDSVRVFNDRGEFVTKLLASEAVRPGSIRTLWGAWKKHMESGCAQYVTNDYIEERGDDLLQGTVIPFNDTLVEVEKA